MIKVKVPELLEKSGLNATDLMRKGNIAYGTALRLSKGTATGITFDVLEALCKLFDVEIGHIIEYVSDQKDQ